MVTLDSEHTDSGPGREAAKWRKKFRQAETERATLAGKVEALQRQQIAAVIATTGLNPAALWASGAQLTDLVDDDGTPDEVKIAAAIAAARDTLGIPATKPKTTTTTALRSGATAPQARTDRFVDAFKPARER
jgi:hypothetical protein